MKLLIKILKRINRVVKVISSINWISFLKLYRSQAKIIVWIPDTSLKYFGTDAFLWDIATVAGLMKESKSFRIVYGKGIGKYHHKKIFFTLSNHYNRYKFDDYTDVLTHITKQLELQGNQVFPKSGEVLFWENKAYMHAQFELHHVNTPETKIYESYEKLLDAELNFPFLVKAEHSCSSEGLYKLNNFSELDKLMWIEKFAAKNKHLIIQKLINMRKDLRVILCGKNILLHYWRINPSKEWKPTSTSYGSYVDFDNFPEQWRQHITDTFKSLKLTTGAFDITWENDDLHTEPIYLEVSPFYQPNPRMEVPVKPGSAKPDTARKSYAWYKQHFSLFHSWDSRYVAIIFKIKHKQVQAYLSE